MRPGFRIGLPSKGRLAELSAELLRQAGLSFRRQERSLFARVKELPIEVTFLRTEDVPVLCAEGAIDLGITGSDLVAESGAEEQLTERLRLGVGVCRLALCVPEAADVRNLADLQGKRIATTFPTITQKFLRDHNVDVHLVRLSGSVEVMVALGVADGIVDLVETGSTLAANGLRQLQELGTHEAVLIQGAACRDLPLADRIRRRLQGVVIARQYSLLEYNIRREKLAEAEAITPGFKSPTVSALEDPAWCAVRVMVRKGELIVVMELLEAIGAVAILEIDIQNCRL